MLALAITSQKNLVCWTWRYSCSVTSYHRTVRTGELLREEGNFRLVVPGVGTEENVKGELELEAVVQVRVRRASVRQRRRLRRGGLRDRGGVFQAHARVQQSNRGKLYLELGLSHTS